jgi:predicted cupin superfamily sugar epimerase
VHPDADRLIAELGLRPHPEGGWYREIYRSAARVQFESGYRALDRSALTCIYYLLEGEEFSALHRLRSDEVWALHAGGPLTVYAIEPAGTLRVHRLGDPTFAVAIVAGTWFGARLEDGSPWALISCAVGPGFEFEDFELAQRGVLSAAFPQHAMVIAALTRSPR